MQTIHSEKRTIASHYQGRLFHEMTGELTNAWRGESIVDSDRDRVTHTVSLVMSLDHFILLSSVG